MLLSATIALISFALKIPQLLKRIFKIKCLSCFLVNRTYFFKTLSSVKKNILLIPGASFKSKCYTLVEKFAELATEIDANFLIIWGSQEEKLIANKIQALLNPKVIICEKLSLDALISLISQVSLLIGSDTGPTHIGWASKYSINHSFWFNPRI